ncbi:MAG TPA: hypothetical protein VHZ50_18380 [Puia sp.]|nr:hypothetical protein [Puia sp.]
MAKQNLQQATKKATYEANVNKAGQLGTDKELFDTELSVIEKICGEFIERVKANIQSEDMPVTGSIEDITLEVKDNEIWIMGNPWLIYQDRGVNGAKTKLYDTPHSYQDKKPPASVFVDWIKRKNLNLRDNKKYYGKESSFKHLDKDKEILGVAWAIATKIYQHGFRPRHVYSKEIPKLMDDLSKEVANVVIQQIIQDIDINPREGGGNRTIIK